jgi:cation transport regulator ChaC
VVSDRWIFGYGSLVWRPAFDYEDRRPGFIRGYKRRFWQASPDHRGTPEAPGRVVTLIEESQSITWGVAYRISKEQRPSIMSALDHREKAGYERVDTAMYADDGTATPVTVYIAAPGNMNYLGPAPLEDIAAVCRSARGPSGPNREYVLELSRALRDIGAEDEHVSALATLVGPSD